MNSGAFQLPTAGEIRLAVEIYLAKAYDCIPSTLAELIPPPEFEPAQWLMRSKVERDPANAPLEQVRSFCLRLGNTLYPHMKLRMSKPPNAQMFLFSVDAHDAFLHAPPGSGDYEALEELKRHNNAIVDKVSAAWDAQNLPTERGYMRQKIQQAKNHRDSR